MITGTNRIRIIMTPLNLKPLSVWGDHKVFECPLRELMDAFIDEAVKSNHEIFRHDFKDLKIKPCKDCGGCFQKEVPCAYLDDFNLVAPDLLQSQDLVIFATGTFSSPLLAALSKGVCFESAPTPLTLHHLILVYLGNEKELQSQIQPYFAGILTLAPEKTRVIRFDNVDAKALDEIKKLGQRL
jgi:hypothetical protein